jgi:hypothetical protein
VINLTIEDCLELLTGINAVEGYTFDLEKSDYNILTSVARQVFKGTALTDRQFDMLVKKFETYTLQFEKNGIDINGIIEQKVLRTPFRTVDRTQQVYIEDSLIVVQFPFNKKLISKIQILRNEATGQVTNNKNKWKFELSEQNIFLVGNTVSHFKFSENFVELFEKISKFKYDETVPGIYNVDGSLVLKNLHPDAEQNAINACGTLDENILKYVDRAKQFGIEHIDYELNEQTLETKLAGRSHNTVNVSNDSISLGQLIDALCVLDRFPLLVVVDQEKLNDIYNFYSATTGKIKTSEQTVMFRLSNDTTQETQFNHWVKQNNLNNWLDNNTKIVYISANKVTKVVANNFSPSCVLNFSPKTLAYGNIGSWISAVSDLKIDYGLKPLVSKGTEIIE